MKDPKCQKNGSALDRAARVGRAGLFILPVPALRPVKAVSIL